eukprot:Awhi_evm1s15450
MKEDLALFGTVDNLVRVYASECGSNIHKEEFRIHMKEDLALFGSVENLVRVYGSPCGANIHKEELRIHLKEDLALFGSVENLVRVYGSSCGANIHKEEFRKHMKEDLALFGNADSLSKIYGSQVCGSNIHKDEFRKYIKEDFLLFGDQVNEIYAASNRALGYLRDPFRPAVLQLLTILQEIDDTTAKDNFVHLLTKYRGLTLKKKSRLSNTASLLSFCRDDEECKWVIDCLCKKSTCELVDIDHPERFKFFIPIENRNEFDPQ